jgi:prepilin peptidase CpaA
MIQEIFSNQLATTAMIFIGVAACAIAVVTDVRERRVPNWLTFATLAIAIVIAIAEGPAKLGITLLVVAGMLVLGVLVHASGLLGGGDVKFLIAISALVGFPNCVAVLLYTGIAGGLLALSVSLVRGRLVAVCTDTFNTLSVFWASRKFVVVTNGDEAHRPLPYALAIAAGFAVLVLSLTYFPALRLPL